MLKCNTAYKLYWIISNNIIALCIWIFFVLLTYNYLLTLHRKRLKGEKERWENNCTLFIYTNIGFLTSQSPYSFMMTTFSPLSSRSACRISVTNRSTVARELNFARQSENMWLTCPDTEYGCSAWYCWSLPCAKSIIFPTCITSGTSAATSVSALSLMMLWRREGFKLSNQSLCASGWYIVSTAPTTRHNDRIDNCCQRYTRFCVNNTLSDIGICIGVRANIHWGGGRPSFARMDSAVTDHKFVLFKHVLCFARIMSTLCPNVCRQTARIGWGQLPPAPPRPVRLWAYASL